MSPRFDRFPSHRDGRDVLVLCYHAVSETWPAELAVTPGTLERQLGSLLAAGYRAVTFTEAVTEPPRGKTLAVTFDDSYRSMYELGYPILSRLGIPATAFVPTAKTDADAPRSWADLGHWIGSPWEGELIGATWDELGELAEAGWEVGSHGRSHTRLTELDDDDLADELERSREDCERHIGLACASVAYPYGDADERVLSAVRAAGYAAGATVAAPLRVNGRGQDPICWPRFGLTRRDRGPRLQVKGRLYRYPRAWNLVQRVTRAARGGRLPHT